MIFHLLRVSSIEIHWQLTHWSSGSNTCELVFEDCEVPFENVLGEEGKAMEYLAFNLAQERLSIGLFGVAAARAALDWTVDYVKERTAFGQPIASFQNTKFVLAEVATEIDVTQAYVDQCILQLSAKQLTPAMAAASRTLAAWFSASVMRALNGLWPVITQQSAE